MFPCIVDFSHPLSSKRFLMCSFHFCSTYSLYRLYASCRRTPFLSCYLSFYVCLLCLCSVVFLSLRTSCWVVHLLLACIRFCLTFYILCHSLVLSDVFISLVQEFCMSLTSFVFSMSFLFFSFFFFLIMSLVFPLVFHFDLPSFYRHFIFV